MHSAAGSVARAGGSVYEVVLVAGKEGVRSPTAQP
jgi:hypothetical protein